MHSKTRRSYGIDNGTFFANSYYLILVPTVVSELLGELSREKCGANHLPQDGAAPMQSGVP